MPSNQKEVVKLSLFIDYIISYVENPKGNNKKLLELTNEFRKEDINSTHKTQLQKQNKTKTLLHFYIHENIF